MLRGPKITVRLLVLLLREVVMMSVCTESQTLAAQAQSPSAGAQVCYTGPYFQATDRTCTSAHVHPSGSLSCGLISCVAPTLD